MTEAPALWLPSVCPATIILDAAPLPFGRSALRPLKAWPGLLADQTLSDGRHFIIADTDGPHHVWLKSTADRLAYVLVHDDQLDARIAAIRRFERRLAGAPQTRLPPGFRPTAFQRHRLNLLLGILDAVSGRGRAAVTTHEIARRLVYPGMTIGRGSQWKSSSQRRRTQRLIDEARALMHGGYLRLLRG